MQIRLLTGCNQESLPSRERGLKSCQLGNLRWFARVAPFTGAWIEIAPGAFRWIVDASLPSRERGLKYGENSTLFVHTWVAPFTGAWIEMKPTSSGSRQAWVAPFTGAWIEMRKSTT